MVHRSLFQRLIFGCFAIFASVTAFSGASAADKYEVTGKDDPELQVAIEEWLDGPSEPALRTMRRLAFNGNRAARLLLANIGSKHLADLDLPDLTYRERRRFFTDGSDHRLYGRRWFDIEAENGYPTKARSEVFQTGSVENWLRHADTMLSHGEREWVLQTTWSAISQNRYAAQFSDPMVGIDDYEQFLVWIERWFEAEYVARFGRDLPNQERVKNWREPLWRAEDEAEVQAGLQGNRLTALLFDRYRKRFDVDIRQAPSPLDFVSPSNLQTINADYRPKKSDLAKLGELLVKEAQHGGFLQPAMHLCVSYCRETVPMCVHSTVVQAGGLHGLALLDTPFEPVISQGRWLSSRRAMIRLAELTRQRRGHIKLAWLPKDQCLVNTLAKAPWRGR